MADWLPQQLGGYRCRNLTAALSLTSLHLLSLFLLFSLLAWSPCPSSVCWDFRMDMNPDGVSGIWQRYAIKAESRCTSTSHGWTESMGFRHCKLWVSQWFGGPEIPLWLYALCPETCCSTFIHLYPLQVGSWLPESQQNTDSHFGRT